MTHFFFVPDHFTNVSAQKQGGELDGDSSYTLLLLEMPEVLLYHHESQDALYIFWSRLFSGLFYFTAEGCSSQGKEPPSLCRQTQPSFIYY